MEQRLEKVKEAISVPLLDLEIVVDDISFVFEGGYYSLNIVLDRINGLDLDAIVDATNIINPIVDELDLFKESYILDVSSKERGVIDER